jgi:uncharacterized protein YqjF (DUF2071 family)
MHWPVPADALRSLVPSGLDVDTYEDRAWIGVVPFRMTDVAPRGVPAVPAASAFPEINVRTYVRMAGRAGVWFLSLDAANRLAVATGRRLFHLPYHHAAMTCRMVNGVVRYRSVRATVPDAAFKARYRPVGPVAAPEPDTLEHWLTERYVLFALRGSRGLFRADVHHVPWPLQPAEAEVETNTMLEPFGLRAEGRPLLHFASRMAVAIWPLRSCRT